MKTKKIILSIVLFNVAVFGMFCAVNYGTDSGTTDIISGILFCGFFMSIAVAVWAVFMFLKAIGKFDW